MRYEHFFRADIYYDNKFAMTFRIASFLSTSTMATVGATSAGTATIKSIISERGGKN